MVKFPLVINTKDYVSKLAENTIRHWLLVHKVKSFIIARNIKIT